MLSQSETEIAQQIMLLLSFYWTGNEDEALRTAQAELWLNDLQEFSPRVVAAACTEWRRMQTKRPMIADLRKLCIDEAETERMRTIPRIVQHEKPKPPDDLIRSYWRSLLVKEWTKSELETANIECTALAHKYGFNTGDDRIDRAHYAIAALASQCPPYDVETGAEGTIRNWSLRKQRPLAAPAGEPAREITA